MAKKVPLDQQWQRLGALLEVAATGRPELIGYVVDLANRADPVAVAELCEALGFQRHSLATETQKTMHDLDALTRNSEPSIDLTAKRFHSAAILHFARWRSQRRPALLTASHRRRLGAVVERLRVLDVKPEDPGAWIKAFLQLDPERT